MTASSSQTGALDTSTTTSAPTITSARPSPVMVSTPVAGEAATGSCPCATSRRTTLLPMSPLPPMTTIFMAFLPVGGRVQHLARARGAHPSCPNRVPTQSRGRAQLRRHRSALAQTRAPALAGSGAAASDALRHLLVAMGRAAPGTGKTRDDRSTAPGRLRREASSEHEAAKPSAERDPGAIVHYARSMSTPATLLMWFQLRSP